MYKRRIELGYQNMLIHKIEREWHRYEEKYNRT
jgi:hypothetical protein